MSDENTFSTSSFAPSTNKHEDKIIYVEFEDGDQRNPRDYPLLKKWEITLTACFFTGMAGASTSSFSISTSSLVRDLHCTDFQAAMGLSLYAMGLGIAPLVTSSFSEEVGRRPVYMLSSIMFSLAQVVVALAPNIEAVLAGRLLGGISGSTGASLVGGIMADIWRPQERALPTTIFAFSMLFSIGLGSVVGGVIESFLGWRWIQWIHLMFSSLSIILAQFLMKETRPSISLIHIARSQRRLTGNNSYKARAEIHKDSYWRLIQRACGRSLYFLLTEPIVQFVSIWVGFTWGVVFCLLEAVTPMFQTVYHFDVLQTGFVYATLSIGSIIGLLANLYQDELYRKYVSHRNQEARLYLSCVSALCLPIGMIIFAWTALPEIHWVVPCIGLTVFMSGALTILQVSFLYLSDCYNMYASSAQAGTTLFRNVLAFIFPLLTRRMFTSLTYKWALTFFSALALVIAPTPFVLFFFGSKIRSRSIVSQEILAADVPSPHRCESSLSHPELNKV